MSTILKSAFLTLLLVAAPRLCGALESIEYVTQERAQELGLEIRANGAVPEAVRVELEFETKGELKGYTRVALEMQDEGKLLLTSTLREEQAKPGRILVSFAADRAKLDKITLKIVEMSGGERVGHILRMHQFVDLKKVR